MVFKALAEHPEGAKAIAGLNAALEAGVEPKLLAQIFHNGHLWDSADDVVDFLNDMARCWPSPPEAALPRSARCSGLSTS